MLFLAVSDGHVTAVKELIMAGADVDRPANVRWTNGKAEADESVGWTNRAVSCSHHGPYKHGEDTDSSFSFSESTSECERRICLDFVLI